MATITKDPISGAYIVKQGDTLSKIASTQGRTLAELLATNPQFASNPNLIRPGDAVLPAGGLPGGMYGENAPVGTPGSFNYATPQPPAPAPRNLASASAGQSSSGGGGFTLPSQSTGSNPTTSFTEALIKMLKDAQQRDQAGQASLMKQSQGITGMGLNDAAAVFKNPKIAPGSKSLGMSAQNQFDPLLLSIENQQKLATQNLGHFEGILDKTQSAYDKEQEKEYRAEQDKLDEAYRQKTLAQKNDSGGAGAIKLTPSDKQGLLAAGFLSGEISQLEGDINKYGINVALEGITDPGQKSAIMKVYGGTAAKDTVQFLDKEYIRGLYTPSGLEQAAADAGFGDMGEGIFNLKDVDVEKYLNYLDTLITQYRRAGYTDKEILNLMK